MTGGRERCRASVGSAATVSPGKFAASPPGRGAGVQRTRGAGGERGTGGTQPLAGRAPKNRAKEGEGCRSSDALGRSVRCSPGQGRGTAATAGRLWRPGRSAGTGHGGSRSFRSGFCAGEPGTAGALSVMEQPLSVLEGRGV